MHQQTLYISRQSQSDGTQEGHPHGEDNGLDHNEVSVSSFTDKQIVAFGSCLHDPLI